ncbi:MAG: hypothetical protein HY921_12115 [Elusimicrobia bacterium]|nr:hypothetical protein [Elusimicrobiota bacterium]
MRYAALAVLLSSTVFPAELFAGAYFQQASFPVAYASVAGTDSDSLGNLYVLGRPAGGASYQVSGFQTPGMSALFSFDTGVSSPIAFAVEGSGIIDILDASSTTVTLKRFQNTGAFVGQVSYPLMASIYDNPKTVFSAAIDKVNGLVYLAYQQWRSYLCLQCLGCGCPPSGYKGYISQYDFSGSLLLTVTMPGVSATYSSCYTPSSLATDPQGDIFVADNVCQQLFKYSKAGSLLSTFSPPSWTSNYYVTVRGMWSDAQSNLYISQPVCGPSGCQAGVVKLDGMGNVQSKLAADSPTGCAWDDRILYLNSAGATPLRRFIFNGVPSVPSESAPIGPVVQHSSSAALSWQSSGDPDGDPVTYYVSLGVSPTQLSPIGNTSQTSFNTAPLTFEATYYWQVVAMDSYQGVPLQQQSAPVVSARLSLQNSAPGAFGVVSGTGTVLTRAATAPLSWQTATDPDGDPVLYDVFWRPASQATAAVIATIPQNSAQVSGLSFGATYYWSVKARDVYNASRLMAGGVEQPYNLVFKNSPPPAPPITSGTGISQQHTLSPQANLAWAGVTDPDGDPVAYHLHVGTNPAALAAVQDGAPTSFPLPGPLFGTTYYWQVAASDPYGGASTSPIQNLLLVLQDNPPTPVVYLTTATSWSQHAASPNVALRWAASNDPDGDPVSYLLEIQTGTEAWPSIPMGAATSITVNPLFETTYYWRVTASDPYGGASTGSWMNFAVHLANRPPNPIVYSTPNTLVTRATSSILSWQDAGDPDGDPTSYSLSLSTDPSAQFAVQQGTATAYNLGFQFGTTYYWSVSATDSFGGRTDGPLQSFLPVFKNSPPLSFSILTGAGVLSTRNASQLLSWQATTDPDGDGVAYDLSLSSDPNTMPIVQSSTAASYSLPFQFGTTYYWQVTARDVFGAATSPGLQTFLPVFRNSPPTVPVNQSKAGTVLYHGFAPAQSFFWQPSTDPDGDPFAYSFYIGTDATNLSVSSPVPLGFTVPSLSVNTAYYYKIVATDSYGAASASPVNWVYYQFSNAAPQAFDTVAATGTFVTRDTTAGLAWTLSTDPYGDPVAYRVFAGTAAASLAPLGDTTQPNFLLSGLGFGTTYYWRVEAYDGLGATTTINGGTQSLLHVFRIVPPSPIVYLTTAASFGLHTTSPSVTLSWSPSANADADPISYRLDLQAGAGNLSSVALGSATNLALGVLFETTYYWRVTASDPYGGASTGAWLSLVAHFANQPPAPFAGLSGSGSVSTRATSQLLSWKSSTDPDGDALTYGLFLSTSPAFLPVIQQSTSTSFNLAFEYGTTCYWHVEAYDGFGGTTSVTGGVQTFLPLFLNDPPGQLNLVSPFKGSPVVSTMRNNVLVSWGQVTTPQGDPITYTVYFGNSPDSMDVLTRVTQTLAASGPILASMPAAVRPASQVELEGDTIKLTLSGLDYYRRYYLRIVATNPYGASSATSLQTFALNPENGFPKAYNYPNPFNPNRGGTHIVFNAPSSGYASAKVSIYSELQDLLFEKDYANIPPGISEFVFDGRDRNGRSLFNGSYICRVRFTGPDDKEIFYLLVVK